MKILIVLSEDLYHYQRQVFAELLPLKGVAIYVLACKEKSFIPKDSKLLKIINSKFPVFKTDPYAAENAQHYIENSLETSAYKEDLIYDYVLNFCDASVIETFNIKFGHVLKTASEIRQWYAASIHEAPYTTIHLVISADNQNFEPFRSLSFSTETGIYNNRDKALYYFSYLIKSVFNDNRYPVQESEPCSYDLLKSWKYHLHLAKIIVQRKFSKVQLNWKLAVLENDVPRIITEEHGHFWADPFIVKEGSTDWIFFEEFDRKASLGKISVVNLLENTAVKKKVVLEKPYHLSFPNVFKHEGNYFMMPEESEAEEQNIYKAIQFPYQWEKHQTILKNIKIVDPVFTFHQGRYWLFFNKIENFEHVNNERLYLYSSPDLFSDQWESHPQNPVVIDKTSARNAGKIRKEDQDLIRVSQNCIDTYGEHIFKKRIITLSEKVYLEEKLPANWDFNTFYGCHTINTDGDISVIDLLIKE